MTVWGASSGSYSDYGVNAVFERKEDAEQYVKDGLADNVEEFDFYPAGFRVPHLTVHRARITDRHTEIELTERSRVDIDGAAERRYKRPQARTIDNREDGQGWIIYADCTDRQAAIKAVSDRAAPFQLAQPKGEG